MRISLLVSLLLRLGFAIKTSVEHLAGYIDASCSIAVQSRGIGLKVILQRTGDDGPPFPLLEIHDHWPGGSLKSVNSNREDRRQMWRLMYTAAAPQRSLFNDVLPHLQARHAQVETALALLDLDGRTERDAKAAAANRVAELNPVKCQEKVTLDCERLTPAYVSGLVRAAGTFAYHDGSIRLTFGSAWLAPLVRQIWASCPECRGEPRHLNQKGEFLISASDAYSFLMWIIEYMPPEDPRTGQALILLDIFENHSRPRWAPLTPTELQKRQELVVKLKELKRH